MASFVSLAQVEPSEGDTIPQKEWGFETTAELADTAWWALQRKTNAEFMSLVPTIAIITESFDSLEIKNNSQVIRIKYNYFYHRVNKQLKFLQKKATTFKIKFKTCTLDSVSITEGTDDKGNRFAYITLLSHKNKKEFTIKFVALMLNGNWFIVDELKLEFPEENPYYKPPIKIKRK